MILRSNALTHFSVFGIGEELQSLFTQECSPNSGSWDADHCWSDVFDWTTHSDPFRDQ